MNLRPQSEPDHAADEINFEAEIRVLHPLLRGYILSIFPHRDYCDDIIQETMAYAWDQRHTFQPGSNFKGWIFKIAYFRTLAFRRDSQRDRVSTFSQEFIQRVAGAAEDFLEKGEDRLQALQECLGELREEDIELLRAKYTAGASLAER